METKKQKKLRLDRESYRRRMDSNPEYKKRKLSQQTQKYQDRKNKPSYIYSLYVKSAKKRNYLFSISKEEFISLITNSSCIYCGDKSLGVDRKDNTVGYTIENCVSCCNICNHMKGTLDFDFFLNHCRKIIKNS